MKIAAVLLSIIYIVMADVHRLPPPVLCPANGTQCTASTKMRHDCVTWPHCHDYPCSTFGCRSKTTSHLKPTACIEWHCHPHYFPPHVTSGGIAGITIFAVALIAVLIGICWYYRPRAIPGIETAEEATQSLVNEFDDYFREESTENRSIISERHQRGADMEEDVGPFIPYEDLRDRHGQHPDLVGYVDGRAWYRPMFGRETLITRDVLCPEHKHMAGRVILPPVAVKREASGAIAIPPVIVSMPHRESTESRKNKRSPSVVDLGSDLEADYPHFEGASAPAEGNLTPFSLAASAPPASCLTPPPHYSE